MKVHLEISPLIKNGSGSSPLRCQTNAAIPLLPAFPTMPTGSLHLGGVVSRRPEMRTSCSRRVYWTCLVGFAFSMASGIGAGEDSSTKEQLGQLRQQNELLQQQLRRQQELIEALSQKVSGLQSAEEKRESAMRALGAEVKEQSAKPPNDDVKPPGLNKVRLSGEAGLAFFDSGPNGPFPNSEFRVDEAKLFVEANVWKDVYFFTELNIVTREDPNPNLRVGELYVDFENVSRLWHQDRLLNLRVGRMDIPFGEEYLNRDAIDNPLISHSLSDIWGVDEGIELYGAFRNFQYAAAVQNGGVPALRDFAADKSLVGRLGFDPAKRVHLSVSAMRTGDLNVEGDEWSELWFGNGFIRALGEPDTTTKFHASLFEGDVAVQLPRGHLKAAGGLINFDDNDTTANNKRDVYYYYVEGLHNFTDKFYAAGRFSQILAPQGFPIAGNGDFGKYFLQELTEDLWRLSLGAGYRWSRNLVLKVEYSLEQGEQPNGEKRNHQNLFGVELAVGF